MKYRQTHPHRINAEEGGYFGRYNQGNNKSRRKTTKNNQQNLDLNS